MYDAPITKKIFEVLRFVVAQQFDVGVSEIARAGGLSKGTTFGILAGLEKEGYISKNSATRKYTVGPELFQLSKLIDRRADLAHIAKPHLERLSKKLNRTVFLGVKDDEMMIRIEQVAEARSLPTISSSIGTRLPLHGGAIGKVLLSLMRDEEIATCVGQSFFGFRSRRGAEADIWSEIEEVRRSGYALDLAEEHKPGIWVVAMALSYSKRSCPAVVWVAGFKAALNEKKLNRIINALRETINDIDTIVKARFDEAYHSFSENGSLMPCDSRMPQAAARSRGG